ncbi:N-acetylmuramoyl-L-alanine amidase LytC [Lachnospiraceae bacterium]|nr:N-acetylmuramoyl-L-alanine amidase LytC [Lachnospiraceae bacterium]
MKKLKIILAAVLIASIFTVSGTNSIWADNLFSGFFKSTEKERSNSANSGDLIVVLDAGHGGRDSGAVGNGLYEKSLTLKIAQYCKAELEKYKGVKVYLTRANDTFVDLSKRVSKASAVKADVFVSIHLNSSSDTKAKGAEVFYPNSNYRPSIGEKGRKLAGAIQKNLVSLGLRDRKIKTRSSMIGSKYPDDSTADYYAVIRGSKQAGFPGVIVEHAFISNPSDAGKHLKTAVALKKLAAADAEGIAACYGLKKAKDQTLTKTKITKLTGKTSSSVSIGWSKVKGASGYEIYRSNSRDGVYEPIASVKKATTVSFRDRSVTSGKTYFYKVRPYKMSGERKQTAGFCAPQKVRLLNKPDIFVDGKSKARAKVSWKQVSGAQKYEIYRSDSKNGQYKKLAVVKDYASFQDAGRTSGKTYFYKVRAVGTGIKGNTYSSFSISQSDQ